MIGEQPDAVNAPPGFRRLWKDRHRFDAKDIWRWTASFATLATVQSDRKEPSCSKS
jgi:hypothetical protein